MNSIFRFIFFILIALLPFASIAQHQKVHKGLNYKKFRLSNKFKYAEALSIFASTGLANYYGDLCDNAKCIQLRPHAGVGVMYRFTNYLTSKSELNYIRLYSKDVWADRNLSFRSGNVEIYTSVMYDYFKFTKSMQKRKLLSPYAFAGFGLVIYNPRGEINGKWHSLRPLKTEGTHYGALAPIIPFGIGTRIKYTRKWDFMLEAGYRLAFTDHLDDVSSLKFKKMSDFSDPLAASLSNKTQQGDAFMGQRGNPNKNDGYFVFSCKVRYTFVLKNVVRNKYTEQHRKIY